ncbi:MAG: DUF4097 family beta strand repeat protein [Anaerolineales bacterium]|nr:DUF4097 family beta strand repeat protein [Anaerolineales bacterium]
MSEETIERTFTVSGSARLDLRNVRGLVVIRPGEAEQVQVTAVKIMDTGRADRTQVEVSQEGNTVMVKTCYQEGSSGWFGNSKPCKVNYTVSLPQGSTVKVRCVSSSLQITDLQGEFDAKSVSGNMTLNELSGPLKLHTVSGDISASRLSGTLSLETVSGDVTLRESDIPFADVHTVSGDIVLETPLGEGPYSFRSVSGDVRLLTPGDAQCSLHLSTLSGRLRSTLPVHANQRSNGSRKIEFQGSGAQVSMNSVSGDLRVGPVEHVEQEIAEVAAPTLSVPPIPSTPPAGVATSSVLRQVEQGEITVEEAVRLLQGG